MMSGSRPQKGESPEAGGKRLIKECELGLGADVVIDASGAEVCMQQAVHTLRCVWRSVRLGQK